MNSDGDAENDLETDQTILHYRSML